MVATEKQVFLSFLPGAHHCHSWLDFMSASIYLSFTLLQSVNIDYKFPKNSALGM